VERGEKWHGVAWRKRHQRISVMAWMKSGREEKLN
jgi:hypothetical protein